jgi:hypothetical protein
VGTDLDTTSINAQQSELLNKLFKSILKTMSRHQHVTGADAEHFQSECALGFIHEYITKELALEMDMVTEAELDLNDRSDRQAYLPEEDQCAFCGGDLEERKCTSNICLHPLLPAIKSTGETGIKHPQLVSLLSSAKCRKESNLSTPVSKPKLVDSDKAVVQAARKQRNSRKKQKVNEASERLQ